MATNSGSAGGFLLGVLVGGIIGGATAMMYTPMPGKKFRKRLAKTTDQILDDVNDYIEDANDVIKSKRKQAESIIDEAKRLVSNVV